MRALKTPFLRSAAVMLAIAITTASAATGPISMTIQAEHFSSKQGGVFDPPVDKESRIGVQNFQNGNWIRFDSINFMAGEYDSLQIYYWSNGGSGQNASGATMRARIDSPTGTIIGSFSNIPGTRDYGYETSDPIKVAISDVTGVHSLVITFEGGSGPILTLDRVRLAGTYTTGPNDAQNYYVATTGDDNNNGTIGAPFKTIQKAASLMKPGSACYIRQGIYRETVKPVYTGLAGAPLTFQAYGNDVVVISGADPVTGWSVHSGSIYKAPMNWSFGQYKDQVLVDGKMAWVARSPNVDENYAPHEFLNWCGTGCYNWKPYQGELEPVAVPCRIPLDGNVTVNQVAAPNNLPASLFNRSANFFQGGLVINHNYYWSSVFTISGSSSTASSTNLQVSKINSTWATGSGPGYISNVFGLLDAPNEWFLQNNTLYLWAPGGGNPSSHLVEAKKRALGFDLRTKQYVNLTGIRMLATSMSLAEASNCVIDNCHFKYVSHYETYDWFDVACAGFYNSPFDPWDGYTGIYVSGSNNTIKNSSVIGSAGAGIILEGKLNTVTNCRIHSCNYMDTYQAAVLFIRRDITDPQAGLGNTVTHCSVKGCARAGIQVTGTANPTSAGDTTRIEYCDFDKNSFQSNETGSIDGMASNRAIVSHNWFHGVAYPENGHVALEDDNGCYGWNVHHNVFWKGDPLVKGGFNTGFHWMLTFTELTIKCWNNTVVDKCDPSRADIDTGWPPFVSAGGLGKGAYNNIYARDDTAHWMFTNAANNDYSLRAGSPAINAGKVLAGMTTTYQGTAPDLGAYEYGEPRWVAGADWPEQPWPMYPPTSVSGGPYNNMAALPIAVPQLRISPGGLFITGLKRTDFRIAVFNAAGSAVTVRSGTGARSAAIDASGFAAGVYVVRLTNAGRSMNWKALLR
jgi:hypothetical protein